MENKQEKLKAQGKDATYKFKSKLVAIRKNIQHFTETVLKWAKLSGNSVWKRSLKTYLPHKLFRRDKEYYLIGQYIHH